MYIGVICGLGKENEKTVEKRQLTLNYGIFIRFFKKKILYRAWIYIIY
jgi:hypothetical protein